MTVTFDPVDGTLIISERESSAPVSKVITVTVDEPDGGEEKGELIEIVWQTDLPAVAEISADWTEELGEVAVRIANFRQLFPVTAINYLQDRALGVCYSFGDLPGAAEQVISYSRAGASHFDYSLTVTAKLRDGEDKSATYGIKVIANCDGGRDALVAAVNARKT